MKSSEKNSSKIHSSNLNEFNSISHSYIDINTLNFNPVFSLQYDFNYAYQHNLFSKYSHISQAGQAFRDKLI